MTASSLHDISKRSFYSHSVCIWLLFMQDLPFGVYEEMSILHPLQVSTLLGTEKNFLIRTLHQAILQFGQTVELYMYMCFNMFTHCVCLLWLLSLQTLLEYLTAPSSICTHNQCQPLITLADVVLCSFIVVSFLLPWCCKCKIYHATIFFIAETVH